jgi:hypothetical protein
MKVVAIILLFLLISDIQAQEVSYICGTDTKTLSLTATDSTGVVFYTWTSQDNVATSGRTVEATAGVWSWFAIDINGCSKTGNHTVIVNSEPSMSILADTVCIDEIQNISALGVPEGYTYEWDFGEDASPATSTNSSEEVSYSSSGTKTILLTVSRTFTGTANGCSDTCVWTEEFNIFIEECPSGLPTCSSEP